MTKRISFAGPSITEKEVSYVLDAVQNGWYENYDGYVKRLEQTFADYLGVKYALATHCCTQALHLAAAALGLKQGDEVIVTDFSWVATAYAIAYTGATCVFTDITPDTWTIDPACIEKAITPRTKAIMLVHSFGQPAEMDEILALAQKYHLAIIEDAAPALGSEYKGKRVGTFGDIACFSFQGAKMAVSGEGGILVTNNEEYYRRACLLASMGRTDSKAVFWSDALGYQYTMGNLAASLALAQLERADELMTKKRALFSRYALNLKNTAGIHLITEKEYCKSNYCYPSILLKNHTREQRDAILAGLRERNIHARPAFPRMSGFPVLERRFENPVAAEVEAQGISLPSAASLTDNDIDFVCDSLLRLL